jgi:hypothetical protein
VIEIEIEVFEFTDSTSLSNPALPFWTSLFVSISANYPHSLSFFLRSTWSGSFSHRRRAVIRRKVKGIAPLECRKIPVKIHKKFTMVALSARALTASVALALASAIAFYHLTMPSVFFGALTGLLSARGSTLAYLCSVFFGAFFASSAVHSLSSALPSHLRPRRA